MKPNGKKKLCEGFFFLHLQRECHIINNNNKQGRKSMKTLFWYAKNYDLYKSGGSSLFFKRKKNYIFLSTSHCVPCISSGRINIGLLFHLNHIFFLLFGYLVDCYCCCYSFRQVCRPLKNVSVFVLCRSFSLVSLYEISSFFSSIFLLLLFSFKIMFLFRVFFFRLLGIRRTILRHLGCF